jgi:heat shock protein HslJ
MKRWLLLLLMFFLSACGQMQSSLANSSWLLKSYGLVNAQKDVLPNAPVTLEVDESEKQAGGSGGCNSYGGDLTVQANSLSVRNIVSTLIACTEPGVAEQETTYLGLLQRVTVFETTETTLTLSAGDERLEFVRQ